MMTYYVEVYEKGYPLSSHKTLKLAMAKFKRLLDNPFLHIRVFDNTGKVRIQTAWPL